jgi:hypothetical protein
VSEFEERLTRLGRELDWPPTPDLAPAVRRRLEAPARRLEAPARRRRPPVLLRRSLALALVALLVLAGGVVAAVPGVRHAVLEFFGLRGATVERRAELPKAPALHPLELGAPTTLERARRSLGFDPLLPRAVGAPPDAVFVKMSVPGGELSLAYRPRPRLREARSTGLGLLVGEFRGDLLPQYLGKIAGQATRLERLRVGGERAVWIEGAPHLFFYRPPDSEFAQSDLRLAGNVLLLERGELMVRLEGAFGRERAIELARSLR